MSLRADVLGHDWEGTDERRDRFWPARLGSSPLMIGRLRNNTERALTERIRELEHRLAELARAATLTQGDIPAWIVDPDWRELHEINDAALDLLRLPAPATADNLIARIDHRDHVALGEVTLTGGHLPVLRVLRPDGESRLIGCVAVPRRDGDSIVDVVFFGWDASTGHDQARDRELAARIAGHALQADASALWSVVARELRHGCRAETVTVVDRSRADAVVAVDPPGSTPSAAAAALPTALDGVRTITRATVAAPVGPPHAGVVVLIDGPGDAAALLATDTTTRWVLDGLVDRQWRDERHVDALERTRTTAEEHAARAAAERVDALAAAAAANDRLAQVNRQVSEALARISEFAELLAREPLAPHHHHTVQHILLTVRQVAPLVDAIAIDTSAPLRTGEPRVRWLGNAARQTGGAA